jgi:hypothetical protein
MFKSLGYDLKEVSKLFAQKRLIELRGLSNRLVKEASIENNYAKAELGVIAYALHKIETKEHFTQSPKWNSLKKTIVSNLDSAVFAADKGQEKQFLLKIKSIISKIDSIDSQLGNYAQSIYDKAKVKQASLAYSYGLSISQSASLTGADKKELQNYIGFTKMIDEEEEPKNISDRINDLRKVLGEK